MKFPSPFVTSFPLFLLFYRNNENFWTHRKRESKNFYINKRHREVRNMKQMSTQFLKTITFDMNCYGFGKNKNFNG